MEQLKMCINTQTPLVQFIAPSIRENIGNGSNASAIMDLSSLAEDVDYRYSTGGVTRMVYPLARQMLSNGILSDAHWVSLNSSGPRDIRAGGITFHHVSLEKDAMKSYGSIKETIWGAVHGINSDIAKTEEIFWSDDFAGYAYYNRQSAELMRKLDREHDFDLFYIHDFQQLPIGQMLDTLKPKMFRWHIPFDASMIPAQWKELLATYFNCYDLVIVSSGKYVKSLKSFGYSGRTKKIYPYVDSKDYSQPSKEEIISVSEKLGVRIGDDVVLVVARMDPMKGQDRAVRMLSCISSRFPSLKLVLVGNGSFSSSAQGLGLSKSDRWRRELEHLSRELGVENRVLFAGHLTQKELDAIYERCNFTILPSVNEGFGLVVVESWLHKKATLVTERAGISELIEEEKNGMLFDPDNLTASAEKMQALLNDKELANRLGHMGYLTSKRCSMEEGLRAETAAVVNLVGN